MIRGVQFFRKLVRSALRFSGGGTGSRPSNKEVAMRLPFCVRMSGWQEAWERYIESASTPARGTHARPAKPLTYEELPHAPGLPPLPAASTVAPADVAPPAAPCPFDDPMGCSWEPNASAKVCRHSLQNTTEVSPDSVPIEELLTAGDRFELREMHILPPGCAEEEEYILLHARKADR